MLCCRSCQHCVLAIKRVQTGICCCVALQPKSRPSPCAPPGRCRRTPACAADQPCNPLQNTRQLKPTTSGPHLAPLQADVAERQLVLLVQVGLEALQRAKHLVRRVCVAGGALKAVHQHITKRNRRAPCAARLQVNRRTKWRRGEAAAAEEQAPPQQHSRRSRVSRHCSSSSSGGIDISDSTRPAHQFAAAHPCSPACHTQQQFSGSCQAMEAHQIAAASAPGVSCHTRGCVYEHMRLISS